MPDTDTATDLNPARLLAKSPPPESARGRHQTALTLAKHCVDTETAAHALFRQDTRWGHNYSRFFQVDASRFVLNLRVAALFHDIGKANEDFQRAVQSAGYQPQSVRHEHLSALILCLPQVRDWLSENPQLDVDAITAAVLSHHLKACDRQHPSYRWCQSHERLQVALFLHHADVAAIFARVGELAGLTAPPPALPPTPWSDRGLWQKTLNAGFDFAEDFEDDDDRARQNFTAALKAGLIVADSVASGLVRTGNDILPWIDRVAHAPAITAAELDDKIIAPRSRQITQATGKPFTFQPFQEQAAALGPRALLLAGCGSGKTLAAWRWAQAQLGEHPLGHILFLYPTRGTATEGFRDYVGWAPEDEAALVHSTAEYELDGMAKNPEDRHAGKHFAADEAQRRLYALRLWSKRWFSATVDQFLSFLSFRYASLCLTPLLADSAIILDEVHSYDKRMFDHLVAFLKRFRGPVLCMTATLPKHRREQLQACGLRVYPRASERAALHSLEHAEQHPRYHLSWCDRPQAEAHAVARACAGQRVLYVVNTVGQCQALAQQFSAALRGSPVRVLAYHSRYRLSDRHTRHKETVEAFQPWSQPAADGEIRADPTGPQPGVIAVTTQVCEMSLDLDADVLVTELAPISSLIQRFGRANRHFVRRPEFRADIYIHPPSSWSAPYSRNDLKVAQNFLKTLDIAPDQPAQKMSQRALADAFERHAPPKPNAYGSAPLFEMGYFALPDDFRDIDQYSVSCVLDEDIDKIEAVWKENGSPMRGKRRALDEILPGFEVSVPKRFVLTDAERHDWLPRYLQIAPRSHYSVTLGFCDQPTPGDAP
ncbi:MAG: CRISPR-associated helicase/endonuclease Cas3 [Haliangiales bacterium]